jgi:hypothetical protein
MPRLPSRETAFGPDRAPSVQRPIARYTSAGLDEPAKAAAEQGRALAQIGAQGFAFGRDLVRKEVQREETHAWSTILQADVAAQANIPLNRDNYENYDKDYRAGMATVFGTALKGVKNSNSRAAIEAKFGVMVERGAFNMQNQAVTREGEVGRAYLDKMTAETRTALTLATDPEQRRALIENMGELIANALENGYINEGQAGAHGRTFAIGYVTDWVNAMPADQRIDVLTGGMKVIDGVTTFENQDGEIDLLPVPLRVQMIKATQTELAASEVTQAGASLTTAAIQAFAAIKADPNNFAEAHTTALATFDEAAAASKVLITDPVRQKTFEVQAARQRATLLAQVQEWQQVQRSAGARASVGESLDSIQEALLLTDNPAEQADLLAKAADLIEGLFRGGAIDAERYAEMEDEFTEGFAVAWVNSHDLAGRVTILNEGVTGDPGEARKFGPSGTHTDFIPADVRRTMLDKANRDLASSVSGGRATARSAMAEAEALVLSGETVDPTTMANVWEKIGAHEDLQIEWEQTVKLGDFVGRLRVENPVVVQNEISRLDGIENKTPFEFAAFKAAQGVQRAMTKGLANDAIAFAMGAGAIEYMPPLIRNNDKSVQAYVAAAIDVKGIYGVEASPLTQAQLATYTQEWEDAESAERVVMLNEFAKMRMPKYMADAFYDTISGGFPAMGLLAEATRRGQADLVRQTLQGMQRLQGDPKNQPADADVRQSVVDYLGNAAIADATGAYVRAIMDVVMPAWVQATARAGGDPKFWDTSADVSNIVSAGNFDKLMRAFVGGIGEREKQRFISFDVPEFNRRVDGLTDLELHWKENIGHEYSQGPHRVGPDGITEIPAWKVASEGMFITIGEGKYLLAFRVGGGVEFALTAQGKEFIFDISKMDAGAIAHGRFIHEGETTEAPAQAGGVGETVVVGEQTAAEYVANAVVTPGALDAAWETNIVRGLREEKTSEYRISQFLAARGVPLAEANARVRVMRAKADDAAKGPEYMKNVMTITGGELNGEWQDRVVQGLRDGRITEVQLIDWLKVRPDFTTQQANMKVLSLRALAGE